MVSTHERLKTTGHCTSISRNHLISCLWHNTVKVQAMTNKTKSTNSTTGRKMSAELWNTLILLHWTIYRLEAELLPLLYFSWVGVVLSFSFLWNQDFSQAPYVVFATCQCPTGRALLQPLTHTHLSVRRTSNSSFCLKPRLKQSVSPKAKPSSWAATAEAGQSNLLCVSTCG